MLNCLLAESAITCALKNDKLMKSHFVTFDCLRVPFFVTRDYLVNKMPMVRGLSCSLNAHEAVTYFHSDASQMGQAVRLLFRFSFGSLSVSRYSCYCVTEKCTGGIMVSKHRSEVQSRVIADDLLSNNDFEP